MSLLKGKQLTSPVNVTGSLFGTASYALTASYAMNGGGGGGGTPGGINSQIQFNDNGTFNGVPVLIYTGSVLRGTGSFSGSFTGDFYGTASWSTNSLTASFASQARPAGNNREIQYNNNGVMSANVNLTFDATKNILFVGKNNIAPLPIDLRGAIVQGDANTIQGVYSQAQGNSVSALGDASRAQGKDSVSLGAYSQASGEGVIASGSAQTVVGKYNTQGNDTALFIIGKGTDDTTRADLAVFGPNSSIKFSGSIDVEAGNNITADRLIGTADLAANASQLGGIAAANYARLDIGNTFAEDQVFSKNVVIQGSASISYLTVIYETASVIYSTGSNQFGDAAADVQTLYGAVNIPTGSLTVSGSTIITGSLIVTAGITGSLHGTASYYQETDPIFTEKSASLATTGSNQFNGNQTITGSLIQGQEGNSASGNYSHAEGQQTQAYGDYSHAEGRETIASGSYSHAEGQNTIASGSYSHAEGSSVKAIGEWSHAEGDFTEAKGEYSHAEGNRTIASGSHSHAEGHLTIASGDYSHAEGRDTQAIGNYSHAEGDNTIAQGIASHAEGLLTIALGSNSHAEGLGTIASANYQHVQGKWNVTSSVDSAFIIGNGNDDSNRSNLIYAAGNEVQITGSLKVTAGITGSLFGTSSWSANAVTASYYQETDPVFVAKSASLATTGSNIFIGNQTVTGSLFTTGSNTLIGNTTLTGSLNISGSTTQIGNNNLFGNTTLSGSIIISGSTATPTVQVYGNITHDGYVRFNPVSTNIDTSISASYIYVSSSTSDLYFSQNGSGYNNVTRLRWLEGNLYTGLLHGGLITSQSSTVYQIGSGSGMIVSLNASIQNDPYPVIQYLQWTNLSASIAPTSASFDQTFVGINSSNDIVARGTPFTDGEFNTSIPIGIILHQNHSTINGVKTSPSVAYGWKQRSADFIRAFGPLKISGYAVLPSGSATGSLTVGSGVAFVDGANYAVDQNNPSYAVDSGTTTSKIFRYYQSGSDWVYNTNNGAGYESIDPVNYNPGGLGVLDAVGSSNYTLQRVFWYPNSVTKAITVYYGNAKYGTLTQAVAAYTSDTFNEAPNTLANAVYLGTFAIKGGTNTTLQNTTHFTWLPGGLFRASGGGGGGGGGGATTLAGLTDVSLSSLANGDLLQYNTATALWNNTKILSGSYTLSGSLNVSSGITGSLFGTSSYAITSSYSISSSFATTTQFAPDYVLNSVTSSMLSPYVLTSSTSSMTVLSSSFAATASLAPLYLLIANTSSMLSPYVLTSSTSSMTVQFANTASFVTASNVFGPFGSNSIVSASFAISASWAPGGTGAGFPFTGNAQITGSLAVTGSTSLNYTNTQTYKIDSTTAGPTILATITTGSNTSAFVNYTINKAANARAGQLIAVWNGSLYQYTDVSTLDIGDTTEFAFTASIVSSNLEISENATSGWSVKMLVNLV
jgi:hypothetical protein